MSVKKPFDFTMSFLIRILPIITLGFFLFVLMINYYRSVDLYDKEIIELHEDNTHLIDLIHSIVDRVPVSYLNNAFCRDGIKKTPLITEYICDYIQTAEEQINMYTQLGDEYYMAFMKDDADPMLFFDGRTT
jgi:hypothetical protein